MEQPCMENATRLLRSGARADCDQQDAGSARDSALRGRLRDVSRNAAREAPDEIRALPQRIPFAAISQGRKNIRGLRASHEVSAAQSRVLNSRSLTFRKPILTACSNPQSSSE